MSSPVQILGQPYDPQRRGFFYHLSAGLRFFFAGYSVLFKNPSLLALSFVPIFMTVVTLIGVVWACVWLVGSLIGPELPPFAGNIRLFAQALVLLVALFLGYLLYLPLARVLLAPFSEAISRRTRTVAGLKPELAAVGWVRAMVEGAKLVGLQIVLALAGFGLGLAFPPIAGPVGLSIAICFVSLDCLDVPLSVKGLKLRQKLRVIWRNKALAIGFGAAGYLTLIIPVVNLLALPVGVIGATLVVDAIGSHGPERITAGASAE